MTDPAAIDLEAIKNRPAGISSRNAEDKAALIAAVEALREREAVHENDIDVLARSLATETDRHFKQLDRAEAYQAREAELAGALAFYRADDERTVEAGALESVFDRPATAVLAKQESTP